MFDWRDQAPFWFDLLGPLVNGAGKRKPGGENGNGQGERRET